MTGINRTFGTIFGATYLLVGLVGFAVTGGVDLAASEGKNLIFFELNPLHNIVHLAVGALLFLGGRSTERNARTVNGIVGGTYLAVGLLGFLLVGSTFNIVALNHADNLLHLFTAAVALTIATRPLTVNARPVRDAA